MTFIDLFCGCGGVGLAFSHYFNCKLALDNDKFAYQTYSANLPEHNSHCNDIRNYSNLDLQKYKNISLITAGFPCQSFSIAGKQKGMGEQRGTLIFEVFRFIEHLKPKAIFLENVPNLTRVNNGKDYNTIWFGLRNLKYKVFAAKLNAKHFGLPQNRERLYLVCFREDLNINTFSFPKAPHIPTKLGDILEDNVDKKYYMGEIKRKKLQEKIEEIKNGKKGFSFKLVNEETKATRTLTATYNKHDREILLYQLRRAALRKNITGICPTLTASMGTGGLNVPLITSSEIEIRRLTPRECARLQGFPDNFKFPVSDSQAYKQIGNSVAIPVVKAIAKEIKSKLRGQ